MQGISRGLSAGSCLFTENEIEMLRQGVNRQSPYGDLEWQMQISRETWIGIYYQSTRKTKEKMKINQKSSLSPFYSPNSIGHKLVAESIAEYIIENKIIY